MIIVKIEQSAIKLLKFCGNEGVLQKSCALLDNIYNPYLFLFLFLFFGNFFAFIGQ